MQGREKFIEMDSKRESQENLTRISKAWAAGL